MGDILFLAHRMPFPPNRGDKIRGFHILRHLAARHRVHLVAFADDPRDLALADGLAPFTASRIVLPRTKPQAVAAAQALLTGRALSLTAFADGTMRRAVDRVLAREAIDAIFVFSGQMAQYLPRASDARVIMDFVDMDSAKFAAYAADARRPMRWMLRREARLMLAHERAVARRADASLLVSAAEAALFREGAGAQRVQVVENGIDTGFFDPAADYSPVGAGGLPLVFTGQMDYRPNIEGVRWFAEDILPKVRAVHPDATFSIVGRNPGEAVQALGRLPEVRVVGEVADVRGWLAAAALVVAPLKLARGIQNKVLEGMAMARPVVASDAAAEGIDHAGTIAVGRGADGIAGAVIDLLGDRARAEALGAAARSRVVERYGWDARLAVLDPLLRPPPGDGAQAARHAA